MCIKTKFNTTHECTECEKKIAEKRNLTVHIKRVHNNIKDYECTECDTKLAWKQNLTRHIKRVHNNIKDYECTECEKKNCRKTKLNTTHKESPQ